MRLQAVRPDAALAPGMGLTSPIDRRWMVSERVAWSTLTMSHKPLFLYESPTSRIDPLLISVVLAIKHIGDVLLAEA